MKVFNFAILLAIPMVVAGCDDVPSENMPTLQQQGFDPDTANLEMCSDGAMREDCSFAPEGY